MLSVIVVVAIIVGAGLIIWGRRARWVEDGHVYIGSIQAGRCCDPPEVSEF